MAWQQILGLGVTASITGALVAAFSNLLNDYLRRRFELRRWRAEFYLRPKVEALRNLHAAMVRSHYEINSRAEAQVPRSVQEFRDRVESQEAAFFSSLTIAEIYLDDQTSKQMHAVLGAVRQMTTSIWLRTPEIFEASGNHQDDDRREPDWMEFTKTYDAALVRLREILHPRELLKGVHE